MTPGGASPSPAGADIDRAAALTAGRLALAEARWPEALTHLEAVDRLDRARSSSGVGTAPQALTGADLDGLGEAAWWSGRLADAIAYRERAVAAYLADGDKARAARVAIHLAADHTFRSESSIGAGWVKRAERLLADQALAPAHGWLERAYLNRALAKGDLETALAHADRIFEVGTRLGDRDLEVMGLQDRGRVLIGLGRVEEGLDALDEAVVAAVSGEASPYSSAAVFCNATIAAEDLTDFRRAQEFADVAARWCERQAISGFPGMCRVRKVELITLRGAWAQAEAEAQRACAELIDFSHDFAGEGFYQIGEIRRRMGDLGGAEDAFTRAHRLGREPQPGLALLRLGQGRADAAATLIGRALAEPSLTPLRRARLLPAEVVVAIATRDLGRAEAAASALESIAARFETDILRAEAATARGLVALAGGDADAAVASLRSAIRAWSSTGAPYETAAAREALSSAYLIAGDEDAAALEAASAAAVYESLGAEADLGRVRALAAEGAAQPAAGAGARGAAPKGRQRRAIRTFMFTDIVGSTGLIDVVGDEAWGRLLAWHDTTIRVLLRDHRGQEVHHAGDGFFVAFESADDAFDCALAIRRRFAEHRREHGFAPSVRIGLHTAEALHTRTGYEGGGVHAAARIGALAGADEILASGSAVEAATRAVAHGSWRSERLRGLRGSFEVAVLD